MIELERNTERQIEQEKEKVIGDKGGKRRWLSTVECGCGWSTAGAGTATRRVFIEHARRNDCIRV